MSARELKMRQQRRREEHEHQTAFFDWIRMNKSRYRELGMFYAIPNGGRRDHATAVAMYVEGQLAGVLDTHLPLPRRHKAGLWIEFKAGKNDLSSAQRHFKSELEAEGHEVHVCRDWTEAARITVAYLGLKGVQVPA